MLPIFQILIGVVDKALQNRADKDAVKGEIAAALMAQAGDLQAAQASIITSEAKSEGWLTRSWRPIAMLNFLALLNAYWFGLAPEYLTSDPALVGDLFNLLTIGIGGYVGGRSVEKAARGVAGILQK